MGIPLRTGTNGTYTTEYGVGWLWALIFCAAAVAAVGVGVWYATRGRNHPWWPTRTAIAAAAAVALAVAGVLPALWWQGRLEAREARGVNAMVGGIAAAWPTTGTTGTTPARLATAIQVQVQAARAQAATAEPQQGTVYLGPVYAYTNVAGDTCEYTTAPVRPGTRYEDGLVWLTLTCGGVPVPPATTQAG